MRNVLAVILGIVIGSLFNMGTLQLGMQLFPLPEGMDPMNIDHWTEYADQLEVTHFLVTIVAHLVGTLVGAVVTILMSRPRKPALAYIIGVWFLAGGIMAATMIPAPTWVAATDLVVAYLPMAWLATQLVGKNGESS